MRPLRQLQPPKPTARSRERRRAQPVIVRHLVMPGLEVAAAQARPRETVTAFLRRTGWATRDRRYGWQFRKGLPTVLELNGEAVLRKHWSRRRLAGSVRFVSYPLGGGGSAGNSGKQIAGLVALVAVSAFAIWAGPLVAGALGFTSAFAGGIATAALGLGGSLLVNALINPKQGATNSPSSTQDQIYSVQAQGNTAKLGQPLPVWYGRLKVYPEFAATPWAEFIGNDQWLNVLLSTSMGSLSYEALYIDDTLLWTPSGTSGGFTGAQVAFYEPGAPVTLFPVNVDASSEVTGQELPDGSGSSNSFFGGATPGAPIGPFAASPPATQAQSIAIDFVFAGGCYSLDPNDSQAVAHPCVVRLIAEYAPINDAGAVIGSFTTLFDVTRTYASTAPIRDSVKVDVPAGRYTVQLKRGDAALASPNGNSAVIWAGLRSFLIGNNSFPDVSTVGIRLQASQSTQGSYKFGVLATRILPVWNGSAFVDQATRNPAWAFLDAVVNSQYGSGLPISKADFNAVVSFATGCDSRGDCFDYRFETAVAVPEAFDKVLQPGRARHFWLGDTVSVVRDEWRDVPTMLLTDREIVRDSTQVSWTMLGDEDPDAVVVEYLDQDTWLPAQVQYPPDTEIFTAENPETKRIDGVVQRAQAYRECAFLYLQSIYRREQVSIGVEYEGRAITLGSVIRLQTELPLAYGNGGAVIEVTGSTLTLDPAPVWDVGPFYIRLRMPNGTYFGPVLVTEGSDTAHAVLDATSLANAQTAQSTTLSAVLAREDGGEYPSFEFGTANSESRVCLVLNGMPNGDQFTLQLVADDIRVHATDLGDPPVLPTGQFPSNAKVPLIVGLNAQFGQGTAEPKLSASWFPAPGAEYYIADVTYDAGTSWSQIYEGQGNQLSEVVTLAALTLRVQAVTPGKLFGPYATVTLGAPTIEVATSTVALNSLIDGIKYQVTGLQDLLDDKINTLTQQIASIAANQDTRNWLDKKELRSQLYAVAGNASAEIATLQQTQVDDEAAFASFQTSVTAQFGDVNASISTNANAIATVEGYAAAQYAVTLNVNGYATGFNLVNGGAGTSSFTVLADKFEIQLPGYGGSAPIPVFTTGNISGSPALGLRGSMFLDGTLNATAIIAGTITGVMIQAFSINTAQLAINSVDINRLIAGAATAIAASQFGSHTGSNFASGSSITCTIVSGLALVIASATFGAGSGATTTVGLNVDGNPQAGYPIYSASNGNYASSFMWIVSGLSSGSHTFTLTASSTGSLVSSGGALAVIDLRR